MPSPQCLLACLFASLAVVFSPVARAQVSGDPTLGAEASIITPDVEVRGELADLIEGGAIRGTNLFHSFSDFNILENQRVYFANPEGIESILSRVTGDRVSNLLGTLGVDGAASLFLINPNGFVFGPDVSLDVAGSLYVTTGDAVALGEGIFSAADPAQSQLLSVAPSTSFFNYLTEGSGNIINRGQVFAGGDLSLAANNLGSQGRIGSTGGNLSLLAGNTVQIRDAVEAPFNTLARGEVLIRALGDVDIESYTGRSLHILSGGAVNVGTATIVTPESGMPGINFLKETIQLSDGTLVNIDGEAEPTLDIRAGVDPDKLGFSTNLNDETDAHINQPTGTGSSRANISVKDINVSALNGSVLLTNQYFPNPQLEEGNILVESELAALDGTGGISAGFGGGQIFLDARNDISVVDSAIVAAASEPGRGITLLAGDNIQFSSPLGRSTGAAITSGPTVQGIGSDIKIVTSNLRITQGAQINTVTLNSTDAGDIIVFANNLEVTNGAKLAALTGGEGRAGNVIVNIGETAIFDDGDVLSGVGEGSKGKGGNIEIEATNLEATNRAILGASTFGEGEAGNVFVSARNLEVTNGAQLAATTSGDGKAGNVIVNIGEAAVFDGGYILSIAAQGSRGEGGNIEIEAANFEVTNGAALSAATFGEGAAGNINFNILGQVSVDNGLVETFSLANSGGQINIQAEGVVLRNDGDISTLVSSGQGSGGKITISSGYTIALEDSDILAFSADGRGGAIDLSQTTLFSRNLNRAAENLTREELLALDGNNRVDINAAGSIESGTISINDASFIENGLTELPDTLVNPDVLVANSCIARSGSNNGTLILTGRDRLPQTPNDALFTPYSTETVQTIPAETAIAEPEAIYRLPDGRLMINRDCERSQP